MPPPVSLPYRSPRIRFQAGYKDSCPTPRFPDNSDVQSGSFRDGVQLSGLQSSGGNEFSANAQGVGALLNEIGPVAASAHDSHWRR